MNNILNKDKVWNRLKNYIYILLFLIIVLIFLIIVLMVMNYLILNKIKISE